MTKFVTINHENGKSTGECLGISEHKEFIAQTLLSIMTPAFLQKGYFISHGIEAAIKTVRAEVGEEIDAPITEKEVMLAYLCYKFGEGKSKIFHNLERSGMIPMIELMHFFDSITGKSTPDLRTKADPRPEKDELDLRTVAEAKPEESKEI